MTGKVTEAEFRHPMDDMLRTERLPHIWCPGCGIGTVFSSIISAIKKTKYNLNDVAMVSGIGCSARMAGYIKLDSYHTTHGRALPFATGLRLSRPDSCVVVASGDGDLFSIGGNHFIHAARRNIDLAVICVNNFNFGMTGGQVAPSTPFGARTTTTVTGNPDTPFNFCNIAAASGAVYVARWTSLDLRRLTDSIFKAIKKRGFSFVEVLAPCPTSFGRHNKIRKPVEMIKFIHDRTIIQNNINPADAVIDFNKNIVLGEFVDIERPTFMDNYEMVSRNEIGEWPRLEVNPENEQKDA